MKFHSTQNPAEALHAGEAMIRGLASDGHLFVPERFPQRTIDEFDGLETLPEVAARLLHPFFEGDPLQPLLDEICAEAFTFETPVRTLDETTHILELFHGPTCAFKDVGARFLASALSRLARPGERPFTILVATSGDTGGAVASAFHGKPGVEVYVLYPEGKVSPRQEHQLTCWGDNITAFTVAGDFDDCQRMVKGAFAHPWWQENRRLTSANSINIGRLLPQMAYYAHAALAYHRAHGVAPGFVVPSGNVGNVCACLWARTCGLPIGDVRIATNANLTLRDFFVEGEWRPRASVPTLASAMDVGAPSNMERLFHLFTTQPALRDAMTVAPVDDDTIRATIAARFARHGEPICPHTACAAYVQGLDERPHQIIVSTAHAAKFEEIVEPIIGQSIPVPAPLASLLDLPTTSTHVPATLDALTEAAAHL